jgi:hypothetical protein
MRLLLLILLPLTAGCVAEARLHVVSTPLIPYVATLDVIVR